MDNKFIKILIRIGILASLIISVVGCEKYDDYKKYTSGSELIYTGKADSVQSFAGRNRILMQWLIMADPDVKSAKVYWNNKTDSVVVPIERSRSVDTIRKSIGNLPEGNINFQIVTFDDKGNKSITVNKSATVYGPVYESTLLNRLIKKAEKIADDVQVSWNPAEPSALLTEITYTRKDGTIGKMMASTNDQLTVLPNYKDGSQFSLRTLYKPEPNAVDTFYSPAQVKGVIADVTALYLANAGFPFLASELNAGNRFGNLQNWVVNSAAKNQGGFGGYDNNPGYGTMSLEYWGTPAITNGKIYQTVRLPEGKYTFSATVQNIDFDVVATYLIAAGGNTLPNTADYQAGLGFYKFTNNALNGKEVSLSFNINTETQVSLGIVSTMNSGTQSLRVRGFKLVYTPL